MLDYHNIRFGQTIQFNSRYSFDGRSDSLATFLSPLPTSSLLSHTQTNPGRSALGQLGQDHTPLVRLSRSRCLVALAAAVPVEVAQQDAGEDEGNDQSGERDDDEGDRRVGQGEGRRRRPGPESYPHRSNGAADRDDPEQERREMRPKDQGALALHVGRQVILLEARDDKREDAGYDERRQDEKGERGQRPVDIEATKREVSIRNGKSRGYLISTTVPQ